MTNLGRLSLSILIALLAACGPSERIQKSGLELQAFQAKEFEATKALAFASVLSVFQDLGYIVVSASLETGFITAKSPTQSYDTPGYSVVEDTKATAFVEQFSKTTKVRLNFVTSRLRSGAFGARGDEDIPIEDPAIYQKAFAKIQEAIFIRSAGQ
jgi:hypothetical protein